jgi:predicted metal-binding protein
MNSEVNLVNKCLKHGAYKAYIIDVDKIPFDKGLRKYCEANYCGAYGKNYACPPNVGSVDEVIAKAKLYKKALIFQTVGNLEDSYDIEGMEKAKVNHSKLAKKINAEVKSIYDDYLQLTAGGCDICPTCAITDDKPCRFPDKAISSLEAYCMNVSTLAGLCGMKYINGQNTVTYFGAYLFK